MLKNVSIVFLLIILVNLSGCFAGYGKHTEENPAGFSTVFYTGFFLSRYLG